VAPARRGGLGAGERPGPASGFRQVPRAASPVRVASRSPGGPPTGGRASRPGGRPSEGPGTSPGNARDAGELSTVWAACRAAL